MAYPVAVIVDSEQRFQDWKRVEAPPGDYVRVSRPHDARGRFFSRVEVLSTDGPRDWDLVDLARSRIRDEEPTP